MTTRPPASEAAARLDPELSAAVEPPPPAAPVHLAGEDASVRRPLAQGVAVVEQALRTMPESPGCYRMLAGDGAVLYVGKAKNLRKRVASYAQPERTSVRIQRMIARMRTIEIVVTKSEIEALLLEANLIKKLEPRYNILMRDDKSFPEILIRQHAFPQILKHRGARKEKGAYFGPFANIGAVNHTVAALQRTFLLRNCTDSVFESRRRPCLEYQIKRCSAPCVGRITPEAYQTLVHQARAFLRGQDRELRRELTAQMEQASKDLAFEKAAELRDRLALLGRTLRRQDINLAALPNCDVLALAREAGGSCIQVFFLRGGKNFGNYACFPRHHASEPDTHILSAFMSQFYTRHTPPPALLLPFPISDQALLLEALEQQTGQKIVFLLPGRGARRRALDLATDNARTALARRLADQTNQKDLLDQLGAALKLESPERVEIYDNSHLQGRHAVGAMVTFAAEGFVKKAYRKFIIQLPSAPGDDYAMLREVLTRRLAHASDWPLPAMMLIDGGKGHVAAAAAVVHAHPSGRAITLLGAAKGADRVSTEFYLPHTQEPLRFPLRLQYLLNRLQDEAHRYAITFHRAKRSKEITRSTLEAVPGIGPKRKRALMLHFGSIRAISQARLEDLTRVEGIDRKTAETLHHWLRGPAA